MLLRRWSGLLAWIVAFAVAPLSRGAVRINELMYHPPSVFERREFIELHNITVDAFDLTGCCVDGIGFCFPGGAMIPGGAHLVLAADAEQFQTAYGFAPDYVYGGQLSNSGEHIRLLSATGAVIDELAYDDQGEWPPTADGQGRSLERIAPHLQDRSPRNWHASTAGAGHTAGAANSVSAAALPPWISEVTFPPDVEPLQTLTVSARIQDATAVSLVYVIDFGSETTLPMLDDGSQGDGAAGDGIFGATIPGQAAGKMIRFKIQASGPTGQMQYPRDDDTIRYVGTLVPNASISSEAPIFHWMIDPVDYQEALDHRLTNITEPAVLIYNGKLYDNIQVRIRGQTSRTWDKPNWKFQFAHGHDFFAPELIPLPADNCDLQSHYSDKAYCREILSHESFRDAGVPASTAFHVLVLKNGEFFGLFSYVEDLDEDLVTRHGLHEDGARYKAYDNARDRGSAEALIPFYEKESRQDEDYSDLYALIYGINNLSGQARTDFLYDNIDIPGMVNYLAATLIIHNNDHVAKNYTLYRDTLGTQRWTMLPSDLDLTFGRNFGAGGGVLSDGIWADVDVIPGRTHVSPSHPRFGDQFHQKYDFLWNSMIDKLLADPPFRQMHYRRTRTLVDELLAPGRYEARVAELHAPITSEAEQDRTAWGQYGEAQTLAEATDLILNDYLPPRRDHLLVTHQGPTEIPDPQSSLPQVVINEIMYRPGGGTAAEFVELYNPSPTESVDMSGWRLQGVALTFPGGTVLLPQQFLLVVSNDVVSRSTYGSGRFIAAQYGGELNDLGERLILQSRQGITIDAVTFGSAAPWPASANGGGRSLELIDPAQDRDRAANWAASLPVLGTPGAANSVAGTVAPFPPLYLNEILTVNSSGLPDENGDYDPWLELYNASTSGLDAGGYYLSSDYGIADLWPIPDGTEICPGGHLLIWLDDEPSEGPLHASFRPEPSGGAVGLFSPEGVLVDHLNYGSHSVNRSFGRVPGGGAAVRELSRPTPRFANAASVTPLILNEYNAVRRDGILKDGGVDSFFGQAVGNGGNWFELVVTQDRLDIRGWRLVWIEDSGETGTLTLSNHPLWSDLHAGTILTFIEAEAAQGGADTDTSYAPWAGDWWININSLLGNPELPPDDPTRSPQTTFVSTVTTVAGGGPGNFSVSNDDWQLTILDAAGGVVFGPAGEGVEPVEGIGNDEVFKLENDPTPLIGPWADYNDGIFSTFGQPNVLADGRHFQDFSSLRQLYVPCDGPEDCDDGDECTMDTCDNGDCRQVRLTSCYELSLTVLTGSAAGVSELCGAAELLVALNVHGLSEPVNGLQVLLGYDPLRLTLEGVSPGDGTGSPWDAAVEVAEIDDAGELTYALALMGSATAADAVAATFSFTLQPIPGATVIAFDTGCSTLRSKLTRAEDNLTIFPRVVNGAAVEWSDCDDANPCTGDSCVSGVCVHEAVTDGTPCPDGIYCNGDESCTAGACVAPAGVDCSPLDGPCVMGVCDETSDSCVGQPVAEGGACDDGQFCTATDVCSAGECIGSGDPCAHACEQCDGDSDSCEWCMFDATRDGTVGGGDFGLFAGCFGACYPPEHACTAYNFDAGPDGCVGGGDFGVFSGCFAQDCGTCATCWGPVGQRASPDTDGWAAIALVPVRTASTHSEVTALPRPARWLALGEDFFIEVWAQGERTVDEGEAGLAAVYLDLMFDAARLSAEGVVSGDRFGLFAHGQVEAAAGVVRGLGGCAALGEGTLGTADSWMHVASVRMRATGTGSAGFASAAAPGPYGIAIFNRFGDLDASQIEFGTALIEVRTGGPGPISGEPMPVEE